MIDDRSLVDLVGTALREVDELAERDRAARAHAEITERLAYLHELLRELDAELGALRREAEGDTAWAPLWRDTAAELRARTPAIMRTPAAALTVGNLDLLRLVAYTSASIMLVQERRLALRRMAPSIQASDEGTASV